MPGKLRKHKRSKYWYVVGRTIDENGHVREWEKSTKQTDKRAAARAAAAIELSHAVPRARRLPLSKAFDELYSLKERRKVSVSELEIVSTKGARVMEVFGVSRDCNTFEPADFDHYVDARRNAERPVKDATIKKELGMLWQALRHMARRKLYTGPDPKELMPDVLEPDEPGDRWLDDPEYVALVQHIDVLPAGGRGKSKTADATGRRTQATPKRDYVVFYCHTGVRDSELYRIEASHFDAANRRVYVGGTKTKLSQRWVPLSPEAMEILDRRSKLYATGPLFPYRWANSNMNESLARACKRAGIEPVSANDLRRTFVSWCCRHGESEINVQKFVGHSPGSTLVRRVYQKLAPEAGRAAVERFPKAIGQAAWTPTTNELAIVNALAGGATLAPEITTASGLSRPSVYAILRRLELLNLVTYRETAEVHPTEQREYTIRAYELTDAGNDVWARAQGPVN